MDPIMKDETPDFSNEDISSLISTVKQYIQEYRFDEFAKTNLFQMLTYALQVAINNSNHLAVEDICRIFNKLNEMNHVGFIALLSQKMNTPPDIGQSFVFTWVDQLYSASITEDVSSVVSLTNLFSKLLESDSLFLKQLYELQVEGMHEGMPALVPMANALFVSSTTHFNRLGLNLIENLVVSILKNSEAGEIERLFQPIENRIYSGQSLLTCFANVMKAEAQQMTEYSALFLAELTQAVQRAKGSVVVAGLSRIIQHGPDAGLNAVHIFLEALLASVQVKDNPGVLDFFELFNSMRVCKGFSAMMLDNIKHGNLAKQNGMTLLVQSLLSAIANGYSIKSMVIIFEQIIAEQGPEKVALALQQKLKYNATTYLDLLMNVRKKDPAITDVLNLLNGSSIEEKCCMGSAAGYFSSKARAEEEQQASAVSHPSAPRNT